MGRAKLLMKEESNSCRAAMARPPKQPLSSQKQVCMGGKPVMPTARPLMKYRMPTQSWVSRVTQVMARNWDKYRMGMGTGAVIRALRLWLKFSTRQR